MKITFTFNPHQLRRVRNLTMNMSTSGTYGVPTKRRPYKPLVDFVRAKGTKYPFRLQDVLHATATVIFRRSMSLPDSLFATGGLYLAIDSAHPDFSISRNFGDFTSGFSHQFGVAFAVMSMSEAFGIPWDRMVPIRVKGRRELDYEAPIPGTHNWLRLEAKGVTTKGGVGAAMRGTYLKKLVDPKKPTSGRRSWPQPTAMVGVVTRAAKRTGESSAMEIIDPDFDASEARRSEPNQLAAKYMHYAGLARFAGLTKVAREFKKRSDLLVRGKRIGMINKRLEVFGGDIPDIHGHGIVGVQWRMGDEAGPDAVWFYQGVEFERIRAIFERGEFEKCAPYSSMYNADLPSGDDMSESFMPDGSYFGTGLGPHAGLPEVDRRETDVQSLRIVQIVKA